MKRLLSLILSLSLIIGILPMLPSEVSAAGVKEISTEYNFTRAAFDNEQFTDELGSASWSAKCVTDASMLNREVSTGEWIYRGGTKTYNNPPSTSTYVGYFNHATIDVLKTGFSIYSGAASSGLNTTVLEIKVDKDDWYKPRFNYYKYNRNGVLNVYLVDKAEFDGRSGWDITNYSYAVNQIIKPMLQGTTPYVTITKLGSVDTYDANSTSNTKDFDSYTADKVYIKAGTYYLFINMTEGDCGSDTRYLHVESIELVREEPLPPLTDIEVGNQSISVGEKLSFEDEIIWKSNGNVLEGKGDVTYEIIDNGEGALLSGKDGFIYGRDDGSATLRVTGEMDGDVAYKDITVTVSSDNSYSGAEQKMYFFLSGYSDTQTSLTFVADEMNAENFEDKFLFSEYGPVRPWAMVSANVTRKNGSGAFFPHDGKYLDLSMGKVGEWCAFKVQVPKPGKYAIDIGCYCYSNGGTAEIYMLPYDAEVMDFQNIYDNIDTYASEENFAASADTYEADPNAAGPKMQSMMGYFVADESLDYSKGYTDYLMIVKSNYSEINPLRYYVYLHTINFVGSGDIASAEIDITDSEIGIGETMSITGVTAKNAAGGVFDLSDTYIEHSVKEGSEDILELMDDGVTFKALSEGKATVETLILISGISYVKETKISVSEDFAIKNAYIYSSSSAVVGRPVELVSRIEQNNRKVLSSGGIESIEIVNEEPEGEVVALLADGKSLEAIGAGSVTLRGVVLARGKRCTTGEITIPVSPITTPYPASFSISFPRVSYPDNVTYLNEYERYSADRNWTFHSIANPESGYSQIKLSTYDHAAIVWKTKVEPRYLAFKTYFSTPGKYDIEVEGVSRYRAANTEIYAVPYSRENEANLESLLIKENEYYLGGIDFYDADQSSAGIKTTKSAEGATGEIANAGEYIVVFKLCDGKSTAANQPGDCLYIKNINFKNKSALSRLELSAENGAAQVEAGETLALSKKLFRGDGSEMEFIADEMSVSYASDNKSVATVSEDGVISGINEGKAKITATVTHGTATVSAELEITVTDSSGVDTNLGIVADAAETVYAYASTRIKLSVAMQSGRWVEIPSEYITYEIISGEDLAEISADGTLTAKRVGEVIIKPSVDPFYKENISDIEISPIAITVVWDSTLEPTIYTTEERENAIENARKYAWAKSTAKNAATKADVYVDRLDDIYNAIAPEGIPRFYYIGQHYDPGKKICRYCEDDLSADHANQGFVANPLAHPWKVKCPECKRLFPSNDFGSFYELGLSDDKAHWNYEIALQKHHELFVCEDVKAGKECGHTPPAENAPKNDSEEWIQKDPRNDEWYEYYGYGVEGGYLTNELYTNMDSRWGVDDSMGYRQPYVSDPNEKGYDAKYFNKDGYAWYSDSGSTGPVLHMYIAYYLHEGVWYGNGVSPGIVKTALYNLIDAFVYTGDIKYGRAGAIILDRVADVYPDMYWYRWHAFRNDGYRGDTCDIIWSNYIAKLSAKGADAFLPAYNDAYVVKYLSEKAPRYETDELGNWKRDENGNLIPINLKDSPGALRKHVEENILLEIYDHMKRGMLSSNFGSHQATLTAAAVALNKMPESAEMLDWMMKSGEPFSTGPERDELMEGLEVMRTYIEDVDRDGMGNENSTHYNGGWLTNSIEFADMLAQYKGYTAVNIFNNPKFTKMFTAHLRATLGNYYCAQIGDAMSTASSGIKISHNNIDDAVVGFKHTKDRMLARAMYYLNGNTAEGLHYTILDKNPESLEKEVEKIVSEDGEFYLGSDIMTGFGFAALRAGAVHNSASADTSNNTSRDFAIYFGASGGHGHIDSLNLFADAFGLNIAPDLGYPEQTGWDPNRYEWIRTTLSHNTVMVDEKEQEVTSVSGTPYHFDDSGRVRIMDVSSDAYSHLDDYRRSVIMVDVEDEISYGVDFFHIKGGRDHLYSFHSQSDELSAISGLSDMEETPMYEDDDGNLYGTYAGADVKYGADPGGVFNGQYPRGYTWLRNVRTFNTVEKDFSVEFKVKDFNKVLPNKKDIRLRLTMVNEAPLSEVSFASALPPQTANNKNIGELAYLLVRNRGTSLDTTFTTVFEPYISGKEYIGSIERVPMVRDENDKPGMNDSYGAVKVTLKNGRVDYVIYSTNAGASYVVDNKIKFSGFAGVMSLETIEGEEKIVYSYLNDGKTLELIGSPEIEKTSAYTGKVHSFTKELSTENYITFTPDAGRTADAEALSGKYVYVENDGVQNGAYKIESARNVGGNIELSLGDVSLIRKYVDSDNFELGYIYNIQEGQSLRIPLSDVYDSSPVFDEISDLTVNAGSVITIPISVKSNVGKELTLIGTSLPRGMTLDSDTGKLTWKPTTSQVGENHVAITASDGTLETTVHFTVEVFGQTTGSGAGGGSDGAGSGTGTTPGTTTEPEKPSTETPEETARFIDLGAYPWAEDAINSLANDGIIKGTSENTFSPAANITRADFAILLVRAFKLSSDNTENFSDVTSSDYFAKELAVARNTCLVNGIGENKFAPRNNITRQDMMVIVYRALTGMNKLNVGDGVLDVPQASDFDKVADYAKEAVSALVNAKLINGKNGLVDPTDYTTRAEVAVLLKRILDYTK